MDPDGAKSRGDLVRARVDLVPHVARDLALGPRGELSARTVGRLGGRSQVGVREQDVARHAVLVLVHAASVVPGAGPHGRVEAGCAVGEPHGRRQVSRLARRVGSRIGRGARRLDAVCVVSVRAHLGRLVSGIGEVLADRDAHIPGGVGLGRDDGDGQRERHRHGHAHDLRRGYPLHRFLFHFSHTSSYIAMLSRLWEARLSPFPRRSDPSRAPRAFSERLCRYSLRLRSSASFI